MSEIKKKESAEAARLINGIDANDRGGSLKAPYWMEVELDEIKEHMCGDTYVDNVLLPRYGVLSLLLRSTPCFVYGHPALKKLSKTAFTDGIHVFISEELFQSLYDEEEATKGKQEGLVPLMMHELMHKLFNHTGRLLSFPPALANIATDLSINTRLREGFPDIEWVPTLKEGGLGFREGDREKYLGLSEESIARDLLQDWMAKQKKKKEQQGGQGQPQKGQGQKGQQQQGQGQGQGQSGQGGQQQGGQQPGQGGQQPGGQGGQPQPGGKGGQQDPNAQQQGGGGNDPSDELSDIFGGDNDNHIVDLGDLIKTMEEAGDLQAALDKLQLPSSEDVEKIGQVKEEADLRRVEAVERAAAQMSQNGGKYPGSHIVDCAADVVRGFARGKLTWRLLIQEALFGEGLRYQGSMEEPSSIYYCQEVSDLLGNEAYLPVELPYKPQSTVMCLIDTSGSVNEADLRAFISEIFELKTASNGFSDGASEIIILSADTVLRGDPIEVTDANCDELMQKGVQVFGRGGTNLAECTRQAVNSKIMKDKKIRSVVYFTDLFDRPPQYADLGLPSDDIAIVYIAAPSTHSQHVAEFAKAVADYARVAEINEGTEIDLSETSMDMPVNPTQGGNKRPGMR